MLITFSELVDQLTAYDSSTNALHYITRFLDGLHSEIRTIILVQRPDSLDTAYTLALLQEEDAESSRKHEFKPWNQKAGYPLPQRQDRVQAGTADKSVLNQKPLDKKLADLKAYRRARGLCDHCGEKWNRDHKCALQVGLHVLDELYALFSDETVDGPTTDGNEGPEPEEICCCLSSDTIAQPGVKTLQFQGMFQQQPVLILLDSGSSTSFISQHLLSQLSVNPVQCHSLAIKVANGELMQCSAQLPATVWSIQQYQFTHDFKVLPITHYDIILGMDWLQLFSPMKVDWLHRWLVIPYKGTTVRL